MVPADDAAKVVAPALNLAHAAFAGLELAGRPTYYLPCVARRASGAPSMTRDVKTAR